MSLCINPACANPQNADDQLFCSCCGSEILLEGRYRVNRLLGEGGFGKTYEVSDRDGSVKVLKILSKNDPKYVELFQREAQVLSQLDHPGIPAVEPNAYFIFKLKNPAESLYCLVMEKITGLDLQKYLRQRGSPIDQNIAVQWLMQLVRILRAVHAQHFLHRDIKPSNIMLKSDGHLALIDFGTVRSITNIYGSNGETSQATRITSALYTPIEQMKGRPVPQSDYFALGRTFVYLLTGQELGELYDADLDELQWRSSVPNLSQRLADFLDELMAPMASQRPGNGEAILQTLTEIQQDFRTSSGIPSPNQRGSAPTRLADHCQDLLKNPSQNSVSQNSVSQNSVLGNTVSPNSVSQINPRNASERGLDAIVPETSASSVPFLVSEEFATRCQQELAEFIGPIAAILCKRALRQNPPLSETDLVETLAQQIASPGDAQAFRRRLR